MYGEDKGRLQECSNQRLLLWGSWRYNILCDQFREMNGLFLVGPELGPGANNRKTGSRQPNPDHSEPGTAVCRLSS